MIIRRGGRASDHTDLFLASALFLFMELAFIRWFPAQVLFLTFFTNTVLLASFLGFSLGCLAARGKRNYLTLTPFLLAVSIVAAEAMEWLRLALQDIIDVGGNKASPQYVFFGTEARVADVASFAIPIEAVAGFFFALIALSMIGVGQWLGRRFAAMANPVEAYVSNIAGSLAGILLFSAFSFWLPPAYWFGVAALGIAGLLWRDRPRRWPSIAAAAALPVLLLLPEHFSLGVIREKFPAEAWSPYYRVNYSPDTRTIVVNLLGHQSMLSRRDPFPAYALPYMLNRDSGQPRFHDILIIGAGSGNDVSRALEWLAPGGRIDAVEIDPIIQQLGRRDHPDRPYQDPRVNAVLGDGRNFLRSTTRKYDLIIFALVDSLVLHSSLSNIRLESFLFTSESLIAARRCLKPDGLFVMYNYFRQWWIVSRLVDTTRDAFGREPTVLTLPAREFIGPGEKADGFTVVMAGARSAAIQRAFEHGPYRIQDGAAPGPLSPDGFQPGEAAHCIRLFPSKVRTPGDLREATDAWPFLYLRNPMIPALTWRGMAVIGSISLALIALFARGTGRGRTARHNAMMFLLGAGFMLLEAKAVVHMALAFGSTWKVNTVVFSAALAMILISNVWVLKRKPVRTGPYYAGLLAALALNVAIPLDNLLGLPPAVQGVAAGALALSPILFAGVVFACGFAHAAQPERALAFNTAGAILGGLAEGLSMLVGFQWLLALAGLIYLGAMMLERRSAFVETA